MTPSGGSQSGARSDRRTHKPSRQSPEHSEVQSQVTLQMRASLHQELARKAFESGMTMRGFIMRALKASGLKVTEADLVDRRRRTP